jgi:hypothetical protein
MIKVLKSFDSAHSAVSWMSQNRIEDTSIETTSTLKSMGMGRIPSGNYHVVLKSRPFLSRVGGAINPANWVSAIRNRGTEFDPDDATDILSRVAQDRAARAASGKGHTPLSIKVPTETIGGRDAVRKISPSRIRPEGESNEAGAVRTFRTDLINPTHLGTDIQEMAGHTGRKINQDTANRLNESVGLNLTSREQDRLAGEMGIARRKKGTGDTLTQSISREDLVNIITKSVINVLKSEHEEPMEGTPEHYANWLSGLTSEDIRRHGIDMQNPLATYAEHYPEDLAKYVGGDEGRYYHFYDIYG